MSRARALGLGGLLLWLAALAWAAALYPGGNWRDPQQPGFTLGVNYWCDLMRTTAFDGRANHLGSLVSRAGFVALAAGLAGLWWRRAAAFDAGAARALVAWGGAASVVGTAALAVFDYEGFRYLHAAAALLAGCGGLAATAVCVTRDLRGARAHPARAAAGVLLALAAATNIAVYLPLVFAGGGESASMPVVQLVATAAFTAWVLASLLPDDAPEDAR